MKKLLFSSILLFTVICSSAFAEEHDHSNIPDYLGKTPSGDEVKISDYKGKIVVVSFYATWCSFCQKELPVLLNIQKKLTKENVQVIIVNYKERRKQERKVSKILSKHDLVVTRDRKGNIGYKFGVESIPYMILIDREGKVKFTYHGYGEKVLHSIVEQLNSMLEE